MGAIGVLGALVAAVVLSPDHIEDGPVICPFRRVTGLPCPGCGLTRSWVYLAHGQWRDSFLAHPFGAVSVALGLALVVAVVIARVRRRPAPDPDELVRRPWVATIVVLWVVFAILRVAVQLG